MAIRVGSIVALALAVGVAGLVQAAAPARESRPGVYQGYSAVGDAAGLTLLIGTVWALLRRYVFRPYRIRRSRTSSAA